MMDSVAPIGDCAEALGRFKGSLRRSTNRFVAPLIRPARFRGLAFIGATPASSDAPLEREVQRYSRAGKEETAEQRADRPRAANTRTALTTGS
jgi:hypothetical protein